MPDDVIVIETDTSEDDVEDAVEEVEEAAEDIADAVSDAVMDSTTIDLVTRVTRCEDAIGVLTGVVEAQGQQIQTLSYVEESQQAQIDATQDAVAEVAVEAADAIEEVAEDIEEGSEEITPDEIPTVREHPFFRKWGRSGS